MNTSFDPSGLRFLHIHSFYPDVIQHLYRRIPGLAASDFSTQTQAVLKDGFSSSHIFVEDLTDMGFETHFIVADNGYAQKQWLKENKPAFLKPETSLMEIVALQIETLKPDVIYTCDPVRFDSRFFNALGHKARLLMGWRGANIHDGMDWSSFDVILSGLPGLLEQAPKLGARNTAFFFPGFPTEIYSIVEKEEERFDVVFSGSWTTGQHSERNQMLTHVADHSTSPGQPYTCVYYLNSGQEVLPPSVQQVALPPRFGISMHKALKRGRIVLDGRANHTFNQSGTSIDIGGQETVNMRLFEATGQGSFVLTQHLDQIDRYFEPGSEIETYRSHDELLEKVRYYLNHPAERIAIAKKGQLRCMEQYNRRQRAQAFAEIIGKHLSVSSTLSVQTGPEGKAMEAEWAPQPTQSVELLLQKAIDNYKKGQYDTSFHAANEAKSFRIPILNIDYLRAACLMHLGKPFDAREALREELHYFPGNESAQKLLDEVLKHAPDTHRIEDSEFQELHQLVRPHTMMPEARLYMLYRLAREICTRDLPGNFVECGVARGGSTAMLGLVIKRYSSRPRHLFSFDSFEGMPEPSEFDTQNGIPADDTGWGTGTCAGSLEGVQHICDSLDISEHVSLIKGYFEDTLAPNKAAIGAISLLHLDADWYSSTKTILNELYDQVIPGGLMQYDDYGCWEGCKKAVDEFQMERDLSFKLQHVPGDQQGMWMQKTQDEVVPEHV